MALNELRAAIDRVLGSLTSRQALVVRRYYGFEGDGATYDELGRELGISGSRIQQIMSKALRELRRPWRRRILHPHVMPGTEPPPNDVAQHVERETVVAVMCGERLCIVERPLPSRGTRAVRWSQLQCSPLLDALT